MSTPVKHNLLGRYSSADHWLPTQSILNELTKIANQPITSSMNEKEVLLKQFLNTIYCGYFDELEGGLILDKDLSLLSYIDNHAEQDIKRLYCKPLSINLSLCRLFLASNQVFYHGEFRVFAKKILSNITDLIVNAKDHKLINEFYFSIDNFRCSFELNAIESILNKQEKILFSSLTNNKTIDSQLVYSKHRSLEDASSRVNMHYKEAQIVEYSIYKKLSEYSNKISNLDSRNTAKAIEPFQINCEFIEVICEFLILDENNKQQILAENVFSVLEKNLNDNEENGLSIKSNLLNLICAGIYLLTVNFKHSLLERVFEIMKMFSTNHSTNTNNQFIYDEKSNYQLAFMIDFLKALPTQYTIPDQLLQLVTVEHHSKYLFNLIFLNKHSIANDQHITLLKSKYNAFQKIFICE